VDLEEVVEVEPMQSPPQADAKNAAGSSAAPPAEKKIAAGSTAAAAAGSSAADAPPKRTRRESGNDPREESWQSGSGWQSRSGWKSESWSGWQAKSRGWQSNESWQPQGETSWQEGWQSRVARPSKQDPSSGVGHHQGNWRGTFLEEEDYCAQVGRR
jgi:hypothetical protein